jgi:uncharacterized membrane protein YfcA
MLTEIARRWQLPTVAVATLTDAARWIGLGLACAAASCLGGSYGPTFALVMLVIATAALVSSIAGFAFSAIAGAMLFHIADDPVRLVQIMVACSIANQAALTWQLRKLIDWPGLCVFFAGGIPGLAAGVWLLIHADRHLYIHALGVFLLVYSAYMLLRTPMTFKNQSIAFNVAAGFLGGITGGGAGFPGAAVTIWCSMKGWDKARQRAVVQPFILIMQCTGLVAISLARQTATAHPGFDPANLLFIPASLLGTMAGMLLYKRLSDRQFARAVNAMLLISGASYLV